jgi:HSP20 family protein
MRSLIPRRELRTMTDRLFGDFWTEIDRMLTSDRFVPGASTKFRYPRMNIKSLDNEFLIEAAIPGLTKEDIKVDFSDGILTISGVSKNEKNEEQNGYVVRELHKSSFSRSISIDEEICDVEKIDAGVTDGVLTIKIPKKSLDTTTPRRIIEVR